MMGLFHKTLKDIGKSIEKEEYNRALAILKEHFSSEKEFEEDLNGLQVAISTYQQRLKEIKALLNAREKIKTNITKAAKERGTGYLQEQRTDIAYVEQLEKKLKDAQDNSQEVEAILAKLWRKDRKKLE